MTGDKSPVFEFKADEEGATFECRLDGPGATAGSWAACASPKAYVRLADGEYVFSVRATDAAKNVDQTPATQKFKLDATPSEKACPKGNSPGVTCWVDGGVMHIQGTDKADTIVGTDGPDVVKAGPGDDSIVVLGGDDIVRGNSGDDLIDGGAGNDELRGGPGVDKILGGTGSDKIHGGAGADVIRGGADGDTILGGAGDDVLVGAAGDDVIRAGSGDDVLRGGPGSDELRGGSGDDVLKGGADADKLYGGTGRDILRSRDGVKDQLFGGPQYDEAYADAYDEVKGVQKVRRG